MIWLTADTHFGHAGILGYTDRPWVNVEEMQEGLIENWNSVIKPNDEVWHLGDFAFNRKAAEDAFFRLRGKKHLVRGNHDEAGWLKALPWESVHDLHVLKHEHHRIVLCHYPLATWRNAQHGAIHAHGHCHGNAPWIGGRVDVGIDSTYWHGPCRIDEVIISANILPYEPIDHHGRHD